METIAMADLDMSLEERAARAAEEEKQKQAAQREAERRTLRDDILPHALEIVQNALEITTDPADWAIPDDVSTQKCLTLVISDVPVMVLRTYEADTAKERWSETQGEYYGYSFFYRGWVHNSARQAWEGLTLANFGEAQKAAMSAEREKQQGHSGYGPLRDTWAMLLAIVEKQDDTSIRSIWDNGDQLAMMTWAISFMVSGLQREEIDPADYARYMIAHALKEGAEKTKEG